MLHTLLIQNSLRRFFVIAPSLALIVSALALSGCSTVRVNVARVAPPRYDIPAGKRLAVMDFQSFSRAPNSGKAVSNQLVAHLAQSGHYRMIERSQIAKVIEEQKFSETDFVDSSRVNQIGRILDVEYVIIGEVTAYDVEDDRTLEQRTKYVPYTYTDSNGNSAVATRPQEYQVEVVVRRGTVAANVRMLDVQTGEIIVSDNVEQSFNQRAEGAQKGSLPSFDKILSDLAFNSTMDFANEIAPHLVREVKTLEYGKTPTVKQGVLQAQNERWDDAIRTWE
ncbi:hypothetical protein JXA32_11100, partial [Candidatus Sumerlaeota bacterium]|nr:hypothetical protein [Candidatus Sumerlaeota bacterium]